MLLEFIYGPKVGMREHTSREVGAALIAGGFAQAIEAPPDPIKTPPFPSEGWKLLQIADSHGVMHYRIVYDNGHGGRDIYADVPGKKKVWKYNPQTEEEGYILQDSGCPAEIIAQWRALQCGDVNHEAIADRMQREKNMLQFQIDEQKQKMGELY